MAASKIPDVYYRQFADVYKVTYRANQFSKFTCDQFVNSHEYSLLIH